MKVIQRKVKIPLLYQRRRDKTLLEAAEKQDK